MTISALARVSLLGLVLMMGAASISSAAELSSTYTDLNLASCVALKKQEEGNYVRYKCTGMDGISVIVENFDDRMMVSYPVSSCSTPQTFIQFNEAGSKIEWRLKNGVPFATILRFSISGDPASPPVPRSWLVVSKMMHGESCPIAYIAGDLPNANTVAREAADSYADRDFRCGIDMPRIASPRAISLRDLVMNYACK